ncbi:hypothetical protein NU219Hw_g4742t1 [Hortaea werneckii]
MTKPTNQRSTSPSPSANTPGFSKGGQSNTSIPPPAPTSPQTSEPDDHTESIVEGDWVIIPPLSIPGSESPGDLPATKKEPYDTIPVAGSVDERPVDSEDRWGYEGYGSGEDDTVADVEENVIGKLAARLAEREDVVQGEEEVKELVERELRGYGIDLGAGE